jgi:5-hydroxyisourate hydrolase-like protein (transthyretin family)
MTVGAPSTGARPSSRATLAAFLVGAAAGLLPAVAQAETSLQEFPLYSCASAPNGDSQAWELKEKPASKMVIGRDCLPGRGAGGIITRSAAQNGYAPARARAYAVMEVPAGMEIRRLVWAGEMWRRDCDWAAELYAVYANGAKRRIREQPCSPKTGTATGAKFKRQRIPFSPNNEFYAGHYPTQIIQRVRCLARRCKTSALRTTKGTRVTRVDVRTFEATAAVQDLQPPAVTVIGGEGLASGEWIRGDQSVRFDTTDPSGIRYEAIEVPGQSPRAPLERKCYWAQLVKAPPCPNGPGQLTIDTGKIPDGHHTAQVVVTDAAGNVGRAPFDVFLDNTPPARVPVSIEGGDAWSNQNGFAVAWQNPPEVHAPINGALYQTRAAGESAWSAPQAVDGDQIARIAELNVPVGQTELRLWRRDQAGNQTEQHASDPVVLRYDPEAPQLGFEASPPDDPTKVTVAVSEKVSGIAGGQMEISREGSGLWQTLPTQLDGARLVARIADDQLPAGRYHLRAQASDLAGNVGVTSATQAITLPLRIESTLTAGIERAKTVRTTIKRGGKRRKARRRVTVLRSKGRLPYGRHATIAGRLTNSDGQPLAGHEIRVLAPAAGGTDQLVAVVHTDTEGRYTYRAVGSHSRTLRLVHPGTSLTLPAERTVTLLVPAASSIHASPRKVRNGETVNFTGRLRSLPTPAVGKLVELQVVLSGRWQTFQTIRTDTDGTWKASYQFRRTCGLLRYRFRAHLPAEAGYPFVAGRTRSLGVRVRGTPCG